MQWFQYGVLLERLQHREELRFGTAAGVLVDVDEVHSCATRYAMSPVLSSLAKITYENAHCVIARCWTVAMVEHLAGAYGISIMIGNAITVDLTSGRQRKNPSTSVKPLGSGGP